MSKKAIYITLAIILSIFIIVLIIIFVKKANKNDDSSSSSISDSYYAVNDVKDRNSSIDDRIITEKVVDNVTYSNFDKLNYEQQTDKDSLIKYIQKCASSEEITHGKAVKAEITAKSNNYYTYVNVTFEDNYLEEYILTYDDINTHSYINCVTSKLWEKYNTVD